MNVGIGAVCGLVGGDGANGTRLYGVNKRATQVMATTHSAKEKWHNMQQRKQRLEGHFILVLLAQLHLQELDH